MNSLEKFIFIYILVIYMMYYNDILQTNMYYIIKKVIDISNNEVEVRSSL